MTYVYGLIEKGDFQGRLRVKCILMNLDLKLMSPRVYMKYKVDIIKKPK